MRMVVPQLHIFEAQRRLSVKPINQNTAQRISLIRYPMIFLIVVSHVPRITNFTADPNLLSFMCSFIVDGLIPLGIPMLTCISGFLVFSKSLDLNYQLLLRKRFVSLIIPLLIWNIPLALGLYFVQSSGLIDYGFAPGKMMYPFDPMVWINGILALTDLPINYPLHFLRDLFAICLLVPFLSFLVRNVPVSGLIIMLFIFIPNLDGFLIRNNMMVITFYIGGMAASQNWDLKLLDRFAVPLLLALVAIGGLIVLTNAGRPIWLPLLAPFILWPASSLIVGTPAGIWLGGMSRASIFLFMMHGIALLALNAVFPNLYGGTYEFFVWLAMSFPVAFMCHSIYLLLDRFLPHLLAVIMGGRKPAAKKMRVQNAVAGEKLC